MQIDILTKVVLPLALFIIMFGMGLGLKKEGFWGFILKPQSTDFRPNMPNITL